MSLGVGAGVVEGEEVGGVEGVEGSDTRVDGADCSGTGREFTSGDGRSTFEHGGMGETFGELSDSYP